MEHPSDKWLFDQQAVEFHANSVRMSIFTRVLSTPRSLADIYILAAAMRCHCSAALVITILILLTESSYENHFNLTTVTRSTT